MHILNSCTVPRHGLRQQGRTAHAVRTSSSARSADSVTISSAAIFPPFRVNRNAARTWPPRRPHGAGLTIDHRGHGALRPPLEDLRNLGGAAHLGRQIGGTVLPAAGCRAHRQRIGSQHGLRGQYREQAIEIPLPRCREVRLEQLAVPREFSRLNVATAGRRLPSDAADPRRNSRPGPLRAKPGCRGGDANSLNLQGRR